MIKKLFAHTAIYGLAPQITRVVGFFTLPLITASLTPRDYGVMGIITAYSAAIGVLATLGLRTILINSFFKAPTRYLWVWRSIYGFLLLWNFVYAALVAVVILLVTPEEVAHQKTAILFTTLLPLVLFGPIAEIGSTFYQVRQKPWHVAIRATTFGALTIVLNVLFIAVLKLGFMGWFWSQFVVGILNNFSYFLPMFFIHQFRPILNFRWKTIRKHLSVTMPIIPHSYSTYLLDSSDRVVMNFLGVRTDDVGRYNVAYMFGSVIQSVGMAAGLALGPLMSERYAKKDDIGARNMVFVLQVVFFLGTFLLSLWLKEIFHVMIRNPELSTMYPLGIVIVMGYNYRPMYLGANNALFFAQKTGYLWRVTLMAGVINVILNFCTIPWLGYQFAAVTTFISLMYMGYAGFFFRVFHAVNSANYYPIRWLAVTVGLTVIVFLLRDIDWLLKVPCSVVALAVVFLLFRANREKMQF